MRRTKKRYAKKIGLPPGTLLAGHEAGAKQPEVAIFDYNEGSFQELPHEDISKCINYKGKQTVTWINVTGVDHPAILESIGKQFSIHGLVLEDIMHTEQRPKIEDYDTYIFIILQMLSYDDEKMVTDIEQVSLIVAEGVVISFQEKPGDVFDPIRERIRHAKGKVRQKGADYLTYCLIDAIVDNYFIVIEKLSEKIELLEEEVITSPSTKVQREIHNIKRETIFLRKSVWPLRELINTLTRGESSLIHESSIVYLRDVYDHTIQIIDTIETLRDIASGLLDLYLSGLSNRMNEIMKVLTIMSVLFIPITFIAGVYGMNFEYMPELKLPFGYFGVWGVFVLVILGMLAFFKRKKWL